MAIRSRFMINSGKVIGPNDSVLTEKLQGEASGYTLLQAASFLARKEFGPGCYVRDIDGVNISKTSNFRCPYCKCFDIHRWSADSCPS